MFAVDQFILVAALLLLAAVLSRKVAARFGVPMLVVFVGVGMIAGSEGLGGIAFGDRALAHGIGTIALVLILFDGGLRTPFSTLRVAWKPALSLATVGVFITGAVTGGAAAWLLNLTLLEGLLLGSIVASTDAAAVFSVLRSQGLQLPERLAATLELESGSNDPMAVFLTVGLIEVLLGERAPGLEMLSLFALQMSVGALTGLAVGRASVWLINRINLDAAGLYPILAGMCGLIAYGVAASIGGSGFLAVYLAGIMIGNSRLIFQRGIFLFHDAVAWFSQAIMFVLLGLLIFPSELIAVGWEGLAVALVLTLVARPLAVFVGLAFSSFPFRERLLLSWVGLRGAVPIILATYPLMFGVEVSLDLFNVVFFTVLISVLVQGWSLPHVARFLGLGTVSAAEPAVSLEIASLRHIDADLVRYEVAHDTPAAGKRLHELNLPDTAVAALVARGDDIVPPRGATKLQPGDHIFIVLRPDSRSFIDGMFSQSEGREEHFSSHTSEGER